MHLISCLASGMAGAENGRAEVYIRGTTDRAAYYTDFEGAQKVTTGADVALDAVGGAVVYVDSLVRVVVRDSDGQVLREFVPGANAGAVELISQSATGRDYATGQTAVGSPTTVQQFLDAVLGSFGATDWMVGTPAATIVSAIMTMAGTIFNVKDPRWGAAGDGVVDDTAAINACIDACEEAGGGIVFFPPGTYLVSSTITLNSKVSLVGSGANITKWYNPYGTGNMLTVPATAQPGWQRVAFLTMELVGGSGNVIRATTSGAKVLFEGCYFTNANGRNSGAMVFVTSLVELTFNDCDFLSAALASNPIVQVTQFTALRFRNTRFKLGLLHNSYVCYIESSVGAIGSAWFDGCTFDYSSVGTGSTATALALQGDSGAYFVTGCQVIPGSSVAETIASLAGLGTPELFDAGNAFDLGGSSAVVRYAQSVQYKGHVASRIHSVLELTDNAAAITLRTRDFGTYVIHRTTGTAQTVNLNDGFEGDEFTLVYWNDTAGITGNITFGSNVRVTASPFTVNANSMSIFHFRFALINGNGRWCEVSALNPNVAE